MARRMFPGDTVDYSVTAEIKEGGRSLWVKVGGTTTIQPDELSKTAVDRLTAFVEQTLDRKVTELIEP